MPEEQKVEQKIEQKTSKEKKVDIKNPKTKKTLMIVLVAIILNSCHNYL